MICRHYSKIFGTIATAVIHQTFNADWQWFQRRKNETMFVKRYINGKNIISVAILRKNPAFDAYLWHKTRINLVYSERILFSLSVLVLPIISLVNCVSWRFSRRSIRVTFIQTKTYRDFYCVLLSVLVVWNELELISWHISLIATCHSSFKRWAYNATFETKYRAHNSQHESQMTVNYYWEPFWGL